MAKRRTIVVVVEGGCVQSVDGIPAGVEVVIRDYDVEGVDEDRLTQDESGHEYVESIWD